jgi:membrane protease YdiL (CAAX protease family)
MTVISLSRPRVRTSALFAVCLAIELLVFAVLPLSSRLSVRPLLLVQACISAAFLAAALLSRRREAGRSRGDVLYAFFVGSTAVLVSTLLGGRLLEALSLLPVSPSSIALSKLSEAACQVATIVLLTAAGGGSLRSIYLARGRLGLGLGVGLAGFAVCAAAAFLPLLSRDGGWEKLRSLAPWILTFALANGFAQELLFRGLFLRRLEPWFGKNGSNLLLAAAFTLLHVQPAGASEVAILTLVLFPLALAWGRLMQKTGGLWGPALFHAGVDCFLILGTWRST